MSLEDRERIEGSFSDILTKIKEAKTVINRFGISADHIPLTKLEQLYTFSAFNTLLEDIYNNVDRLDNEVREFIN